MATKTKKPTNLTLTKLAAEVASRLQMPQARVKAVLAELVAQIHEGVRAGHKVTLTGLGSFVIRVTKARTMKSALLGGKTVKVPAKRKPTFRPAAAFKQL